MTEDIYATIAAELGIPRKVAKARELAMGYGSKTHRRARKTMATAPAFKSQSRMARHWRERLGLSRASLASLTGYSVASIARYELGGGATPTTSEAEWRKYRMACAAVDAGWTTWEWADAAE